MLKTIFSCLFDLVDNNDDGSLYVFSWVEGGGEELQCYKCLSLPVYVRQQLGSGQHKFNLE